MHTFHSHFEVSVPSQKSELLYTCVLGVSICASLSDYSIGYCSDSLFFILFDYMKKTIILIYN